MSHQRVLDWSRSWTMTSQYTLPDLETVLQWSHYDVACYLRKLQLEECAQVAKTHQIDGQRLLELRPPDINQFPLPFQGKLCKLVDDIKRADERRNWKGITKKIQQVSADVWKASKGTVSRLIRDGPPKLPPRDYNPHGSCRQSTWARTEEVMKESSKLEFYKVNKDAIYDDCIAEGATQQQRKQQIFQTFSEDRDSYSKAADAGQGPGDCARISVGKGENVPDEDYIVYEESSDDNSEDSDDPSVDVPLQSSENMEKSPGDGSPHPNNYESEDSNTADLSCLHRHHDFQHSFYLQQSSTKHRSLPRYTSLQKEPSSPCTKTRYAAPAQTHDMTLRKLPPLPTNGAGGISKQSTMELSTYEWFVGSCNRQVAAQAVRNIHRDGAFLVRYSSSMRREQPYTLVVYYNNSVYNVRIWYNERNACYTISRLQGERFRSLPALLDNYQRKPLMLDESAPGLRTCILQSHSPHI
uniref:SH2 domain-containing protein n=1 Tax=Eptatretus burgeri TaxID=7764 RepID=A0A8C4WZ90_EPTBU